MPQQRILVSGGAGFLGNHLYEKRVAQGQDVTCVDNYFSGCKTNVAHLIDAPNFETIRHDGTMAMMSLESDVSGPIRCPDISLMKPLTRLKPLCTLKTGRTKSIEDFRRQRELGEPMRSTEAG